MQATDEVPSSQFDNMTPTEVMESFKLTELHMRGVPQIYSDARTALEHIRKGMSYLSDVAGDLEEHDQSDVLGDLESSVKGLIDLEAVVRGQKKVLDELIAAVQTGDPNVGDGVDFYSQGIFNKISEHKGQPVSAKYHAHEKYQEFKEIVWNAKHPNEPMPSLDPTTNDDDIEVSATRRSLKCPLTQEFLVEPVTSKTCKHTYSKSSVISMLRRSNHSGIIECPVAGCRTELRTADLYEDTLMERLVAKAKERGEQPEGEFHDVE
ncbi:zinc-finger of the MIZ type in Nse subunit-domain-containing protein [Gongronella butleri]|nr:zinc-finger of the MIZ type in Nse subunit-domain-containing protein [Gongronella butleri]